MRRVMHDAVNVRAVHRYRRLQQNEAASLALTLIRDPENFDQHIFR